MSNQRRILHLLMRQGGFAAPKNQLKGGNADMMSKYGCRSLNSLALITHRVIQNVLVM